AESAIFVTISDPPFERTIIAAYKKGRELSTAARLFIDMTKRIADEEPFLKIPKVSVVRMDLG
ncbi:hypothetical protein LJC64_05165, partial [Ruminococcaceae bacterium OttesenSCG-928-A11]|nr:hypothetical protein [Ruminococcaceae bacterium OttesenSCG-928-A11]